MCSAPLMHHSRKLDVVRHFTPNWFTVTMGTGVLALLLAPYPALRLVAEGVWVANIGLFALFTLLYAARWALFPREAALIFAHPVMPMFLGAIPMGFATLINGTVVFAHAYNLALTLWNIDAALAVLVGLGVPFAMFTRQRHALETMTAVWLLPVVACEVAAASAGGLAPYMPAAQALALVVEGYALWALSVPLAFGILAILFMRLVLHKLPAPEMGVTSWLAVGPLGTGALALLLLGQAAPAALAPAGLESAATVAQGGGLIGGLIIWAYGAWWLLLAMGMTLTHIPRGLPFNMGWWGFTFPFGVFILATRALAAQTHLAGFALATHGLTALFTLLWLMVAGRTLAGAYSGHLFVSPCLLAARAKAREA
ncbi:TDT family transporter [Acidocella sp. KAb 2-4]|uniref:TDT family transporter n=1 Tax=Acidocella sp. KAb 2-4 TaxID=2885158 RepID=UPI001D070900|nr:TDT family transporter [Acidocella sp. KAb 2-4]MCB5944398.1 TDT family transporter [Acidocella sp. KAb 2-4]